MSSKPSVHILSAVRTPIGAYLGALSPLPAPRLGAAAIQAALERASIRGDEVDEVYMGNVLSAGVGQAPARQAAIFAGLPNKVPCTTISKVCGSGLQSVVLAARAILVGGKGVLGPKVVNTLRRAGLDVSRLAGDDRYATSAAVARAFGKAPSVVVASGVAANLVDAAGGRTLGLFSSMRAARGRPYG